MWRPLELVIASVCCAISFPVIGFKESRHGSWLPEPPDQAKLDAERLKPTANWFHLMKDLLVNSVRGDPEWWAKFFSLNLFARDLIIAGLVLILVMTGGGTWKH